ncbi:MAG TPA: NF038122 family metalloprotease [Candidatus Acidoferrum sp.]|nr:NF038122 family metalloprotease [Candidatus Acidoferrum sp.]
MRTTIRNLVCACLLLAASSPARALTIVRTNDASMSDPTIISPADAAAASAAFDYAAGQIMALYSDPVQINIILAATTDPTVLGQSNAPLVGTFTYDQIRTLLINDNTAHPSPDGTTSTAALPAVNPYACTTFLVSRGLAKALGNIPSDATNDGTFTFGTTHAYTYEPANRAVPGRFDFIGVALHEITEIMGRVARLNQTGNCNRPYDVFRFLGAGTQSLIFTDSNVYFSVDGGTTNLKNFNANGNGGDLGDWASGSNDAFNAFSDSGVENNLTSVDVRVMDVIGWDLTHPPFFMGERPLSNGVYYLQFPNGTPFGYYSYLTDPRFIYHFDMGFEYWFDANNADRGIFFYDFMSNHFFYTSPSFPFPYLYDFSLNTVLYYYPDPNRPGHYTTNPRYFYNFATGQIITM